MKIVFCCGVFDMFHYGHLKILERARAIGDYLIVGVVQDLAVKKQKGEDRPVVPYEQRKEIVRMLKCVDEVIEMKEFNPIPALEKIQKEGKKISIYVRGEDQNHIPIEGIEERFKLKVIQISRTPDVSTTEIIKKLKK